MVRIEPAHVQLHVASFDSVEAKGLVGECAFLEFEERENLLRAHQETKFC